MQSKKRFVAIAACGLATVALMGGGLKAWAENGGKGETEEAKVTLSKAQLDASIKTALKAKPGKVVETEAESEKGKTICEVKILAAEGKTYKVEVDVAANRVIEIEEEDNNEKEGEDKD